MAAKTLAPVFHRIKAGVCPECCQPLESTAKSGQPPKLETHGCGYTYHSIPRP